MNKVKYIIGWVFSKIFYNKTRMLLEAFTIPKYIWSQSKGQKVIDHFIRYYLGRVMLTKEKNQAGTLQGVHRDFWEKDEFYFKSTQSRCEKAYIPAYSKYVEGLQPLLTKRRINRIVEFGTGDGQWLNYLSKIWKGIDEFIGVDISAHQIQNNAAKYPHLQFLQSELLKWAEIHAAPNMLFHTMGGVLEYLSEESIIELFKVIKTQAPDSLILMIEPIHGQFNMNSDIKSQIIGYECSYTHNYPHLLESCGIDVLHREEKTPIGMKWLTVLGST